MRLFWVDRPLFRATVGKELCGWDITDKSAIFVIFDSILSYKKYRATFKGEVMNQTAAYNKRVGSYDIDFTGRATYIALISYIFKVAGEDADAKGFGVTDLNHDNCSWVLTRLSTEFSRRLPLGEEFSIETWVNDVNRMITTRNMILRDSKGEEFAWAVTQWTVIDLDKRRALDIREHANHENMLVDKPSPITNPDRLRSLDEPEHSVDHRVVYSDLDFNRHVNSGKYIEWMVDMLPLEWATEREVERIDMNFVNETIHGDNLVINYKDDEGVAMFEVVRDETSICRASIRFVSSED